MKRSEARSSVLLDAGAYALSLICGLLIGLVLALALVNGWGDEIKRHFVSVDHSSLKSPKELQGPSIVAWLHDGSRRAKSWTLAVNPDGTGVVEWSVFRGSPRIWHVDHQRVHVSDEHIQSIMALGQSGRFFGHHSVYGDSPSDSTVLFVMLRRDGFCATIRIGHFPGPPVDPQGRLEWDAEQQGLGAALRIWNAVQAIVQPVADERITRVTFDIPDDW